MINVTEAHATKTNSRDEISISIFARFSFVKTYPTSDYDQLRKTMADLNWRDDARTGIHTEYHLATWDLFQLALQRNFRSDAAEKGLTPLDERDRDMLRRAFTSEGSSSGDVDKMPRFYPPYEMREKFEGLRRDLRDTAFIILTDAHPGQFDSRINPFRTFSFVKMSQAAEFLEFPIYILSIFEDHAAARKLVERTGNGPLGGRNRGAFYLMKTASENDIKDLISRILEARVRTTQVSESHRESYTQLLGGLGALFVLLSFAFAYSRIGRFLTYKGGV